MVFAEETVEGTVSRMAVFRFHGEGDISESLIADFRESAEVRGVSVDSLDNLTNMKGKKPYVAFQAVVTGKYDSILATLNSFRENRFCSADMLMCIPERGK